MKKFFPMILFLIFLCMPGFAQEKGPLLKYSESKLLLGTVVALDVCYDAEQESALGRAVQALWSRMGEINVRLNPYDEKSDIALINRSAGSFVQVHKDVYALLKRSVEYKRQTEGVFDVTVGSLMALWKRASKQGHLPAQEDVVKARDLVDARRIEFADGFKLRLPEGMSVDASGNAQGYAADEVAAILKDAGFAHFMMDAGGEIFAAGFNCEGRKWRIGVKDPLDPKVIKEVVELQDNAVSTSGNYEKYYEINGQRWTHIMNPLTGYPENSVVSATVIAPTAIDADVLSTALCVLGPVKGLALVATFGAGYGAVVYSYAPNGNIVRSASDLYERVLVKK